jgi:hydrogenase/urease accessory protein HupE
MMRLVILLMLALFVVPAWAHKASDAYLVMRNVESEQLEAKLSLSLLDLDLALPELDSNSDRHLSWSEVQEALPAIASLLSTKVRFQCGQQYLPLNWRFESLEKRSDANYLRMSAKMVCQPSARLQFAYQLFDGLDSTHRLVVGGELNPAVLSAGLNAVAVLRSEAVGERSASVVQSGPTVAAQFIPQGMHHILGGADHLAFLLALLLPIPLFAKERSARSAWSKLLKTITGFTLGHSLTLVLVNLNMFAPESRWVEACIAISIGVSAAANLRPHPWLRSDLLALIFGLVHGLGFAGVIEQASLSATQRNWALGGFNIGVELGQLLALLVWCGFLALAAPLLQSGRRERWLVRGGSWCLILLSLYWLQGRLQ